MINEGGQTIGIVGLTTQILESISSPTGAEILGFPFGPGANGETNNMALLAAQLQPVIDDLRAQVGGQWSSIYEHSTELIYTALSCRVSEINIF